MFEINFPSHTNIYFPVLFLRWELHCGGVRRAGGACPEVGVSPPPRHPSVRLGRHTVLPQVYLTLIPSVADPHQGSEVLFDPGIRDGKIRIWDT